MRVNFKNLFKNKIVVMVTIFAVVFLVFLYFFLRILTKKSTEVVVTNVPQAEMIEVNFGVLENPELKELEIFEQISLPEEIGRENPFIHY
jgi:hypothetical protein